MSNVWKLARDDDEPITASGAIDSLKFLRNNDRDKCVTQFHKHAT